MALKSALAAQSAAEAARVAASRALHNVIKLEELIGPEQGVISERLLNCTKMYTLHDLQHFMLIRLGWHRLRL